MNNKKLKITVYNHHFTLTDMDGSMKVKIEKFLNRYRKYDWIRSGKKFKKTVSKVFAAFTDNKKEYRLHINQLHPFLYFLGEMYIDKKDLEVIKVKEHVYGKLDVKMNKEIIPRDYQIPYIKYLEGDKEIRSKLIGIQTGKGKGVVSIYSLTKINKLTAIIVLPKYIEKWEIELRELTDIYHDDVITVRGGDQLRYVMDLAENNKLKAKFIIFSNRTLLNYIKNYEVNNGILEYLDYQVPPVELFKLLKVGVLLFDEVHQDFHGNFKITLYTDTSLVIGLSATLTSEDPFLMKMYSVMFPHNDRPKSLTYDKYIRMLPVSYRLDKNTRVNHKNYGTNSYSHVEFEKSIMRNPNLLKDYLNMIIYFVELGYIKRRKDGDKLAVFASTVKLCTIITDVLKEKYKDLTVERYVEDDPFENIIEPDIRVTTLMSGGTAVDIKGLITVVQTINVSSIQANIQSYGRLRNIKGKVMEFYYVYCRDIEKHVDYHKNRLKTLGSKSKSIMELTYDKPIGSNNRNSFMRI